MRRRVRLPAVVLAAVLVVAVAIDVSRAPERQLTTRALITGLRLHRALVAPWLAGLGVRCRFTPSCSRYAERALTELGAVRGSWYAARRLLRCGPWTPAGTVDPPPRALASGRDPP